MVGSLFGRNPSKFENLDSITKDEFSTADKGESFVYLGSRTCGCDFAGYIIR